MRALGLRQDHGHAPAERLIPQFYEGDLWGRADVLGVDPSVEPITRLATLVGSVFQNPKSQFFNLTSNDELAFGLEAAGVDATRSRSASGRRWGRCTSSTCSTAA